MIDSRPGAASARNVYSVSELNSAVRGLLEQSFPLLWVEGEISNLAKPRSGHWYFSLKDETAQVRCAMFANKNKLLNIKPENGDQVLIRARVGLYAPRGEFQLVAEHLEDAGAGALQRAFEALKQKLSAEGLFEPGRKRALPARPACIGVITSPTGAAIRDIVSVLKRRFPLGRLQLYPVPVQGDAAVPAIVHALQTALARGECDVLLMARGGGSIEDLWTFNEEAVARAIVASSIPVVTGVGHETDITIADFAADLRAATPSAAAECICPDQQDLMRQIQLLYRSLCRAQHDRLQTPLDRHNQLIRRLALLKPQQRLLALMQQLDERESRLIRSLRGKLETARLLYEQAAGRLHRASPSKRVGMAAEKHAQLAIRLRKAMYDNRERQQTRWLALSRQLNTVSPLATLTRGYAIAQDSEQRVLTDAQSIAPGQALRLRLARGEIDCRVIECRPGTKYSIEPDRS